MVYSRWQAEVPSWGDDARRSSKSLRHLRAMTATPGAHAGGIGKACGGLASLRALWARGSLPVCSSLRRRPRGQGSASHQHAPCDTPDSRLATEAYPVIQAGRMASPDFERTGCVSPVREISDSFDGRATIPHAFRLYTPSRSRRVVVCPPAVLAPLSSSILHWHVGCIQLRAVGSAPAPDRGLPVAAPGGLSRALCTNFCARSIPDEQERTEVTPGYPPGKEASLGITLRDSTWPSPFAVCLASPCLLP